MIKNFKQYLVGRLARIMCALLDRQDIQEKLKSLFNQILIDDKSQKILAESIGKRCLQEQLWKSANIRPAETNEFSYAAFPNDLTEESFRLATKQSAEYIANNMAHLYGTPLPLDLLSTCISERVKIFVIITILWNSRRKNRTFPFRYYLSSSPC